MTQEAYEVMREHLRLPKKIKIKQTLDNGETIVHIKNTDKEHFIEWIARRVAINSLWDYMLRMIEQSFVSYSKDKEVIEYYLSK